MCIDDADRELTAAVAAGLAVAAERLRGSPLAGDAETMPFPFGALTAAGARPGVNDDA